MAPPLTSVDVSGSYFSGKRRDALFSFSLLMLALGFIWICRTYGPEQIRQVFGQAPFATPIDLLLLFAAVLAAMLLHEAGHLVASLLLGFQVLGGSIGPLHIQTLAGDWKLSWSFKTFFTGSVSAIPRSMNQWRRAMILVISAGPMATLATGLAAAQIHPVVHPWIVLQIYFVQVSMLLFFLGCIPNSRHAQRQNDARLLVDLLEDNTGAEELELKVLLKQHVLSGDRPEDFALAFVARLAAFRGRIEGQILFAQAVVQWALDSDRTEVADAWDLHALYLSKKCAAQIQNSTLASSACFDVIFREDMESARNKFARVDCDALFPACFAHRVRAAQHIAAGQLHRAPAHILRAQYALPRGITYYALERTLLDRLHMKVLTAAPVGNAKFKSATA